MRADLERVVFDREFSLRPLYAGGDFAFDRNCGGNRGGAHCEPDLVGDARRGNGESVTDRFAIGRARIRGAETFVGAGIKSDSHRFADFLRFDTVMAAGSQRFFGYFNNLSASEWDLIRQPLMMNATVRDGIGYVHVVIDGVEDNLQAGVDDGPSAGRSDQENGFAVPGDNGW